MSITPASWLFVVTGRSNDEVDEALGSDIAKAFAMNFPAEIRASHAAASARRRLHRCAGPGSANLRRADHSVLHSEVPVSVLTECLLAGRPREVIDQAAEWRDHGLRYLVVCNVSVLQAGGRTGLAASAPFLRILRGLLKL